MIDIQNLTMAFGGVRSLDRLTVALDGRIVGIVGPNGAGKTTLLNVISGFVKPVEGRVLIDDEDILEMTPYDRARWGIRRSFQTEQVVDDLSVRANIEVMVDSDGAADRGSGGTTIDRAIEMVGLEAAAERPTRQLNAFERRLVELARAVAGTPRLLMLDEPAAGLSEHETQQLGATLEALPGETGAQLMLIDHDVDLIASLCETTAVLDFGRLITYGPTRESLTNEAVKEAYLGLPTEIGVTAERRAVVRSVDESHQGTDDPNEALIVEDLSVARGGRTVVEAVDLRVAPGEVTALLGANGAGKSSLVLGIAGVVRPLSGSVRLGSVDLVGMAPHKIRAAGVAAVPEGHRILTELSVVDNLQAAGAMLDRADADAGVEAALDVFPELRERLDQRAGTMSGGQQQMLALAQALVGKPSVLIADELSLGLAPVIVSRLVEAIEVIVANGTGVLLIEQFTAVALQLATSASLMEGGSVTWSGPAAELEENPELLHQAYLAGDFDLPEGA